MERRFKALARERGAFIGVPIGVDPTPQGVEEFLDSCDAVHYEGPVGDVLARAYWEDGEEAGAPPRFRGIARAFLLRERCPFLLVRS